MVRGGGTKQLYSPRKNQKTIFESLVPFEGKRTSGDENEYNLFYGEWGLNIALFNNFFKGSNIFRENGEKNLFKEMTIL